MQKLLMVGDSPTVNTGFAEVVRNLANEFKPYFDDIEIWGINYFGWPHDLGYKIYPAGFGEWNGNTKLTQLLNLIYAADSDYTHIFFLCDAHNLTGDFASYIKKIATERKIHITFYFPVDAPLERKWLDLVEIAGAAVTYTEYGRQQVELARPEIAKVHVLPHGVDTTDFFPREDRDSLRKGLFNDWVKPDDILFVNVNRNERRKALVNTLQVFKGVLARGVRAKLYLHCPKMTPQEGTDLELVGAQLGLPHGVRWSHGEQYHKNCNGIVTKDGMNDIYNAADFVLSTSLGEGWGLSLSEGLAAGAQIIAPRNTSCAEIGELVSQHAEVGRFTLLPLSTSGVTNMLDSSRVRYPVNIEASVDLICELARQPLLPRFVLPEQLKEILSWERIAGEFAKLMGVEKAQVAQ